MRRAPLLGRGGGATAVAMALRRAAARSLALAAARGSALRPHQPARSAAAAPWCCRGGAPAALALVASPLGRSAAAAAAAGAILACSAPRPACAVRCEERGSGATAATGSSSEDSSRAQAQQQQEELQVIANLAPIPLRVLAALIDGLLLLAGSALTLLCGLKSGRAAASQFDGVDWESFIYVWSHLPTLCTLSVRRNTLVSERDGSLSVSALQWPLHCDISPTALLAHIYCDVWWNGQSPGKWLLGIRTVRMYNPAKEMDSTTAVVNACSRYLNLLFAVDYWWELVGVGGQGQCVHNWLSGTTVVWCARTPLRPPPFARACLQLGSRLHCTNHCRDCR